jgi:phage protein D
MAVATTDAIYPIDTTPDQPDVRITVDGEPLAETTRVDVVSVETWAQIAHHASASVLVQNWSADSGAVTNSESTLFQPGKSIEIELGYHSDMTTVFDGVIAGLRAIFAADARPMLEVRCRSRSLLLDGARRSRFAEDASDDDVANTIASAYGLSLDSGEASPITQPAATQHDVTDWEFLRERAAVLGRVLFVSDTTLAFRPYAQPPDDPLELEWGRNLLQVRIEQNLAARVDPIEITSWNEAQQEALVEQGGGGSSGVPHSKRAGVDTAVDDTHWPLRAATVATTSLADGAETAARAAATAAEEERSHVAGVGRSIGLPAIAIDSWLQLSKVGDRFGGLHYVSGVRHRLDATGYTTEFWLGSPQPLLPPPPAPTARDNSAPSSTATSSVVLAVVDSAEDPDGLNRVKLSYPWRTDAPDGGWAALSTVGGGSEQGVMFVPDEGQTVVVSYLQGDPRFPIVLGAMWNAQQKPPQQVDRDNAIRSIVTRSGHALEFDDADSGKVTLRTTGGHTFVLDDSGTITLTEKSEKNSLELSDSGAKLTAGSGDIVLSATSGAVKIDALRVESSASSTTTIKSSASMEVSASGSLTVRGATVMIN